MERFEKDRNSSSLELGGTGEFRGGRGGRSKCKGGLDKGNTRGVVYTRNRTVGGLVEVGGRAVSLGETEWGAGAVRNGRGRLWKNMKEEWGTSRQVNGVQEPYGTMGMSWNKERGDCTKCGTKGSNGGRTGEIKEK